MNIIIPLLISLISGLSTILGTVVILFKIKKSNITKFITFCISFSMAIMIGISVTDLIPNSFFNIINNYNKIKAMFIIIISFISGVGIVLILNKFIKKSNNSLYKVGILNMIVLMIHNFPEGIATFLSSYTDLELGLKLSFAIMLHNIPEGIAIAVPIYYATNSKSSAFCKTLISGLSEPFGALIAFAFLHKYINNIMISIVLLFVSGVMIAISIHEMLPITIKYKCNKYLYGGLLIGMLIIIINVLLII